MNRKNTFKCAIIISIGICCLLSLFPAAATNSDVPVPAVIQNGFKVWAEKETSSYAFDVWKKDGLLDNDKKPTALANYFSRIDRTVGNYKSYEVIDTKSINQTSQIFYIAINFEHAAVYARFLVFQSDKGWVVQNMDFSAKPEAIMPWLAFAGVNYSE